MVAIYAPCSISDAIFYSAVAVAVRICLGIGDDGIGIPTGGAYFPMQIVAGIVAACIQRRSTYKVSLSGGGSLWILGFGVPSRPIPSSGALKSTLPGPREGSSILNVDLVVVTAAVHSFMFGHTFNLEPAPGYNAVLADSHDVLYTFMLCGASLSAWTWPRRARTTTNTSTVRRLACLRSVPESP